MMINTDKFRGPQFIFLIYILAASVLIMIFKFIFPGSQAPLLIYSGEWRFIQGFLEVFNLFPALAFSALVIPFGLGTFEDTYQSFSEMFFKHLLPSVITAIIAVVIYGAIFFFAYPVVKDKEEEMRFNGELYHLAKKNAQESSGAGDWFEASQFLAICDSIWFNEKDKEMVSMHDVIAINLDRSVYQESRDKSIKHQSEYPPLSEEYNPLDATQAVLMSREAFANERYFDAHWLANKGAQLAVNGSVQETNALQLAGEAWEMIASLAPNQSERKQHELFNTKLEGYKAMNDKEWIRAYYIFLELLKETPNDPDAVNFLAVCEEEAAKSAFFIDEMVLSMGKILTGAVFSLPNGDNRAVMRFTSLTLSKDIAYGMGFDYIDFDENMNLRSNGTARYVKLMPISFDSSETEIVPEKKHKLLVLTHSLDRYNEEKNYKYELTSGSEPVGGIILDINFEDFLLLANVRKGLQNLHVSELFEAAGKMENAGYVKQIFQAEVLNRFGSVLFFLPMAIFVIVIAWRYRAKQKPRYLFILMLPILPVVFHAFIFLYRALFNTLGIWLVLSIGFTSALIVYIITLTLTLFISLVVLSAQHS